jgi:hypothetical protein
MKVSSSFSTLALLLSAFAVPAIAACEGCIAKGRVHEADPVERAQKVVRYECFGGAGSPSPDEELVLRNTEVLRADPAFRTSVSTRSEGGQTGGQTLSGTNLLVRTSEGVSAKGVQRVVRCYNTRALIGQADPADSDPGARNQMPGTRIAWFTGPCADRYRSTRS